MDTLSGIWRLVASNAWDEGGRPLAPPYGNKPIGQITFCDGRMLAALCIGDSDSSAPMRGYTSYGGIYSFDGAILQTVVDMASDDRRIGSVQRREVSMNGPVMILRPPQRAYGSEVQRRELTWERVWRPN
jgi:hypothetical protein